MIEFSFRPEKPIDLDSTLDCGQTFRWVKDGEWWKGVVRDTVLSIKKSLEITVKPSSTSSLKGRFLWHNTLSWS